MAAAGAGFVIALYNPISKARPWQLGRAFECLKAILPGTTPVIFGRAAGRPDERIDVYLLADADAGKADMATCIIIGSPEPRRVSPSKSTYKTVFPLTAVVRKLTIALRRMALERAKYRLLRPADDFHLLGR